MTTDALDYPLDISDLKEQIRQEVLKEISEKVEKLKERVNDFYHTMGREGILKAIDEIFHGSQTKPIGRIEKPRKEGLGGFTPSDLSLKQDKTADTHGQDASTCKDEVISDLVISAEKSVVSAKKEILQHPDASSEICECGHKERYHSSYGFKRCNICKCKKFKQKKEMGK